MGRAADLLGQHDRGARIEAGAAQRLGHAQGEEAELAHLAQHLARHEARLLPFRPLGLHLLLDEAAQLGADQVVVFGEDGMCHGGGCYTPAMSRDKRLQDRSIYPHWCTDTVRFCDQDAAGHINNVAICAYMETARLTFMRDMGMMAPREDGVRGISAGMTMSFLAKSHWPGKVELGTGVLKIGSSSITVGSAAFKDDALHRRGRDDGGPAQGQDAPSDRRGLPGGSGKVPAEGLSGLNRGPL